MNALEKILDLIKNDEGKCFIVDSFGEVRAVLMSLPEYKKLKDGSAVENLTQKVADLTEQIENVNRQITAAQKEEEDDSENTALLSEENEEDSCNKDTFYIEPLELN